ncbi:MAG: hypothetical protein HFE80_03305 [Clostridiaceae bacterium]|nr:hypothetical protein [Clostridiaceae bacterium]
MSFFFYGFFAISLGWLGRGVVSLFRWFQARRYIGPVSGRVIRYRPNFRWSGHFVATVEYFAEGALYREPWIPAPWREELQEGKSIHLLYDPRRPCRFVLAGDNALLRRGLSGLFLALCYLLIAFGYNRLL